jgi:hypothetical protein
MKMIDMTKLLWGGSMVEEILHLLSERNRYLSQFCAINKVQIDKMKNKDFEQLNEFYLTREHILCVIEKIELLVNQKVGVTNFIPAESSRLKIQELLDAKDNLIKVIIDQDLEILSGLEKEKSSVLTELKGLQKSTKILKAYKSNRSIDKKVDEEI